MVFKAAAGLCAGLRRGANHRGGPFPDAPGEGRRLELQLRHIGRKNKEQKDTCIFQRYTQKDSRYL